MLHRVGTRLVAAVCGLLLSPRVFAAVPAPVPSTGLRLEDAVILAETRNERARISDLQVLVADAAVDRARAGFLPVVTATGTDQQHLGPTGNAPPSVGQANLTVSQPVINPSAWLLYAQAGALAEAQRAQNADDKRLLAFDAARAFFAVLSAEAILEAALRQLDTARANLANTQARAQSQLASTNDATRAELDMASSTTTVETDRGALANAYVQLSYVLNASVPPGGLTPPDATLDSAQQPPPSDESLVRFAFDHRPDLVASRYSAVAARDFADEPLLRQIPTLAVQGQAAGTTSTLAASGRWHDESVTATLTWTIYDAGVRYADKRSRDAQASIADLTLQTLRRSVAAQVHAALATLQAVQGAFHVAEKAMWASRRNVDETALLYRQGLAKAIELVNANNARFAAEVNFVSAQYALAQAYLDLRQAVGVGPLGRELI